MNFKHYYQKHWAILSLWATNFLSSHNLNVAMFVIPNDITTSQVRGSEEASRRDCVDLFWAAQAKINFIISFCPFVQKISRN